MQFWITSILCFILLAAQSSCFTAHGANPEDEDIADEDVPAVPVPQPAMPQPETQPDAPANPQTVDPPVEATPPDGANSVGATPATITIPREEWEAFKARQEQLEREVGELRRQVGNQVEAKPAPPGVAPEVAPGEAEPPVEVEGTTPGTRTQPTSGGRNYLLLPDISFVMQAKGLLSSDKRDEDRRRLRLTEGELAIQGYVYPNVRAEAFIVGAPAEDEPFQLEEGHITFLGLRPGLNINVGRKFAPFGRTGETHNHSWLYSRQLLPLSNLVAGEALTGDGVNFHYLLPLKGKTFARASFGIFSGGGTETQFNVSDPGDPFFGGVPAGPGAGYDRFYNGRLWLGHPIGKNGEFDFGISHARGSSQIEDDSGNALQGRVNLLGLDATYRRFMSRDKRLLLRGEYFRYQPNADLPTRRASGYYALGNYRLSKFKDIGVLYERSGFPQAPGQHENALSLILTKQLTEQFYIRLTGTHGKRAGEGYNQLRLQFTAGVGPHTHNLE